MLSGFLSILVVLLVVGTIARERQKDQPPPTHPAFAAILGLQMGALLGGAVLTETVFGLAGVGRMLFEAITARDYPIIQAFTVVIAVAYMLINMIVDVSYGFLDPRIRLE